MAERQVPVVGGRVLSSRAFSINSNLAKRNGEANMIKQPTNWHQYFTGILGLCLGLALQADAQQAGPEAVLAAAWRFGGGSRSSTSTERRQHRAAISQQHHDRGCLLLH